MNYYLIDALMFDLDQKIWKPIQKWMYTFDNISDAQDQFEEIGDDDHLCLAAVLIELRVPGRGLVHLDWQTRSRRDAGSKSTVIACGNRSFYRSANDFCGMPDWETEELLIPIRSPKLGFKLSTRKITSRQRDLMYMNRTVCSGSYDIQWTGDNGNRLFATAREYELQESRGRSSSDGRNASRVAVDALDRTSKKRVVVIDRWHTSRKPGRVSQTSGF